MAAAVESTVELMFASGNLPGRIEEELDELEDRVQALLCNREFIP